MILPLISLSTMIYSPLQETLAMSTNYGRIFAAAKRVFDFLQLKSSIYDRGKFEYDDVVGRKKQGVAFESVFFSYVDKNRSEEHTSELQSRQYLVCRLLLEKK